MRSTRTLRFLVVLVIFAVIFSAAACTTGGNNSPSPSPEATPTEFPIPTDLDPEIRKYFLTPSVTPSDTDVVEFQISCKGYSFEDIANYFDEVVLRTEYGDNDNRIHKWTSPIIMYVDGRPTNKDRQVINTIMQRMNSVRGFPGIQETLMESNANLVIHFADDSTYDKILPSNIDDETDGFASCNWTNSVITNADIGIRTSISQNERNSVIWEEIVQCTGLQNDSYLYPDSLFYQGYNEVQEPTVLDWLLFELLYHPDMKPNLTREECAIVLIAVLKE